jgi:hypothetical protein
MTATDPVQRQPAGGMPCHCCAQLPLPLWECRFCTFFRRSGKKYRGLETPGKGPARPEGGEAVAIEAKQEAVH